MSVDIAAELKEHCCIQIGDDFSRLRMTEFSWENHRMYNVNINKIKQKLALLLQEGMQPMGPA